MLKITKQLTPIVCTRIVRFSAKGILKQAPKQHRLFANYRFPSSCLYSTSSSKQPAINKRVGDIINAAIKKNSVVLFMKGTPGWPQCGFSRLVVQILDLNGVEFHAVDVLADDELRQGIKEYSNWPTIPQLYVNGEFIGGADIVRSMYESGELEELFKKLNVEK